MQYVGADNERHRPIMIHRALFGAVERFFAILLEHYAGAFPAWLAPVQVTVLPVADRHDAYALRIADRLRAEGFRVELVDGAHADTLGARIRRAKSEKVPYVLVVGDEDVDARDGRREPARQRRARARRRRRRVRRASRGRGRRAATAMTLERLWAGWRATYIERS